MPHHRRAFVSLAVAAGVLLAAASCGAGSTGDSSDAKPVRIGLLAALTGTNQAVGTDLKFGFQLYLDTHDGKLGGHPIDLRTADEGDGAQTALPEATKLVKDQKVVAMTGIVASGSVAAVAPLLHEAKIPLVGANAQPQLKDLNRVWQTGFVADQPGAAIAQYLKDRVDGPVYVIGPDYQGGNDELRGFTDAFAKAGGKLANPTGQATLTPFPSTGDFTAYLSQVKATGAKAVYSFYGGQSAVDFVKNYARSDVADLPLYAAGSLTEGAALTAEGDAAKNVYSVANYSQDLDNQANRTFIAAWRSAHPDTVATAYAMASYDAAAVLDRAIAGGGRIVTPEGISRAIAGLGQIDSPRGAWQFGQSSHAPVQKWYLRQVRPDGRALSNVLVQDLATLGS
jgi:branched-chain amino acid transport system substrate-binding protein